jgi:cytochrome c biogenesis protein CcmG, thiol:disulfide interchange protein DsbE
MVRLGPMSRTRRSKPIAVRPRRRGRDALLVAALLVAAPGCQGKGDAGDAQSSGALGTAAPRYTGKTLDGEYVALDDYLGKVVLLNIWATWCTPCRDELPELQALHRKHGPDGFTVVGVSVDKPQALGQVRTLVKQIGIEYPIVFDPGGDAVLTFDVSGYPTSFLLDRSGKVLWRRNGIIRPNDSELEAALRSALSRAAP